MLYLKQKVIMMNLPDYSKICFECGGKCCKWKYAKVFSKFNPDSDEYHMIRGAIRVESPYGMIYLDEVICPKLDEDGKCTIYDTRPKTCREFPFNKMSAYRNLGAWRYICPLFKDLANKKDSQGFRIL